MQDNLSVGTNSTRRRITCVCGFNWLEGNSGMHYCDARPITPPRGVSMPQTQAHWEKRAETDQELILAMRDEIAGLKHTINQLRQK